jgi:hypothetical protein
MSYKAASIVTLHYRKNREQRRTLPQSIHHCRLIVATLLCRLHTLHFSRQPAFDWLCWLAYSERRRQLQRAGSLQAARKAGMLLESATCRDMVTLR